MVDASHRVHGWETRRELLEFAAASGYRLSGTQLSRLHQTGLIAKPVTRSQGRGRGKASFYPPGTRDRLVEVLAAREKTRVFAEIEWRLWWRGGGEASPAIRDRLTRAAGKWEQERGQLVDLISAEEAGDLAAVAQMEVHYRSISFDRAPPALAKARRNVGRTQFATVFRVLAEVASGRFSGYPESFDASERSPEVLVERALEVDRARSDQLAGAGPWFEGSSEADLLRLSQLVGSRAHDDPGAIPEEELGEARQEIQTLQRIVVEITPVFEQLLGPGGLGFGVVGRHFREQSPDEEAWMLSMWLELREDTTLRKGMRAVIDAAEEAEAMRRLFDAIATFRREIPAYAEVLSDEAMAAALQDESRAQALNEEVAQLYDMRRSEVDEFFGRHPEIESALAVFEAA